MFSSNRRICIYQGKGFRQRITYNSTSANEFVQETKPNHKINEWEDSRPVFGIKFSKVL